MGHVSKLSLEPALPAALRGGADLPLQGCGQLIDVLGPQADTFGCPTIAESLSAMLLVAPIAFGCLSGIVHVDTQSSYLGQNGVNWALFLGKRLGDTCHPLEK